LSSNACLQLCAHRLQEERKAAAKRRLEEYEEKMKRRECEKVVQLMDFNWCGVCEYLPPIIKPDESRYRVLDVIDTKPRQVTIS
jgi:thiol-disulfide isomerase/thioredoxin